MQHLSCGIDEIMGEGLIGVVNFSKLVEVFFNVALTAEDGVDLGLLVICSTKQSRVMSLDGP